MKEKKMTGLWGIIGLAGSILLLSSLFLPFFDASYYFEVTEGPRSFFALLALDQIGLGDLPQLAVIAFFIICLGFLGGLVDLAFNLKSIRKHIPVLCRFIPFMTAFLAFIVPLSSMGSIAKELAVDYDITLVDFAGPGLYVALIAALTLVAASVKSMMVGIQEDSEKETVVDENKLRRAPIASACFMGLGQILYLKQYLRGFMYAVLELFMLFFCFVGRNPETGTIGVNGRGPFVESLIGLVTLGDPHPELSVKLRDNSVFMMITGLIVVIIMTLFMLMYYFNIRDAKKSVRQIIEKKRFPTFAETRHVLNDKAFPYFGMTPVVVLMAFFTVIPLIFAALVAFTNYSSPDHVPQANLVDWVGLANFKTMFASSANNNWFQSFGRVAVWTVAWAFLSTITCYLTGMFFAIILVDKRIKIAKVFRTIFILPYAIPTMLSLFIWQNILNGTFGPINQMLIGAGLISNPIPWLSDPNLAKLTLVLVNIWIGFPYSMILITSNMTAIPSQLYEAAIIDGANKWQQFKSVTFPLVLYQTMPILIMQFAGNINNFGAVFFLTAGDPKLSDSVTTQAGATDIMISWIYKLTMFNQQYHLASVLSILVFIVLVPFAVYNFTQTKSFKEGEI